MKNFLESLIFAIALKVSLTMGLVLLYAKILFKQQTTGKDFLIALILTLIFYGILAFYDKKTKLKSLTLAQEHAEDLLEVCKMSVDLYGTESRSFDPEEAIDHIKSVVAKAEGRIYFEGIAKAQGYKVFCFLWREEGGLKGSVSFYGYFWVSLQDVEEAIEFERGPGSVDEVSKLELEYAQKIFRIRNLKLFHTEEQAWEDCVKTKNLKEVTW